MNNEYKNQVGFWGLTDKSEALLRNLTRNSLSVSILDSNNSKFDYLKEEGFSFFDSINEIIDNLFGRKIIFVNEDSINDNSEQIILDLINRLPENSIIIDFATKAYKNAFVLSKKAQSRNIGYIDCKFVCNTKDIFLKPNILISGKKEEVEVVSEILKQCVGLGFLKYVGLHAKATYLAMVYQTMEMSIVRTLSESINLLESNNDYFSYDIEDTFDFFNDYILNDIFDNFNEMHEEFNDEDYELNNFNTDDIVDKELMYSTLKTGIDNNFSINHLWNAFSFSYNKVYANVERLDFIPKEEFYFFGYYDFKNKKPVYEFLNFKKQN